MYKTIKLFTTKNIHVTIYNNYYKTTIYKNIMIQQSREPLVVLLDPDGLPH